MILVLNAIGTIYEYLWDMRHNKQSAHDTPEQTTQKADDIEQTTPADENQSEWKSRNVYETVGENNDGYINSSDATKYTGNSYRKVYCI